MTDRCGGTLCATATIVIIVRYIFAVESAQKAGMDMDRTIARAHAMKLVYEWEMGGEGGEETRINLLEVEPNESESDFMNRMFDGVVANAAEIDQRLAPYLKGWTLDRLTRVDLAILRLAVHELTLGETPTGVVINEAVELANQYSTDKAGGFINGVLGNLARDMEAAR